MELHNLYRQFFRHQPFFVFLCPDKVTAEEFRAENKNIVKKVLAECCICVGYADGTRCQHNIDSTTKKNKFQSQGSLYISVYNAT